MVMENDSDWIWPSHMILSARRMILIGYGQVTWCILLPSDRFWVDKLDLYDSSSCSLENHIKQFFIWKKILIRWEVKWCILLQGEQLWLDKVKSHDASCSKKNNCDWIRWSHMMHTGWYCSKENNCDWIRWSHKMHTALRRTIMLDKMKSHDAYCSKENNYDWIRWSHMMRSAKLKMILIGYGEVTWYIPAYGE